MSWRGFLNIFLSSFFLFLAQNCVAFQSYFSFVFWGADAKSPGPGPSTWPFVGFGFLNVYETNKINYYRHQNCIFLKKKTKTKAKKESVFFFSLRFVKIFLSRFLKSKKGKEEGGQVQK